MATSKELLKAIEEGKEIRITIGGEPTGGLVEYSPRRKGDRYGWVYTYANGLQTRYGAKDVAAVTPTTPVVEEAPAADPAKPVVTPEMVQALADLRSGLATPGPASQTVARRALRVLMAAGVFAEIDAAALAEPDASPQVSKCTCPPMVNPAEDEHYRGCPEAPANRCTCPDTDYRRATGNHHADCSERPEAPQAEPERTAPPQTGRCDHCNGGYKPKKDGTFRPHDCWRYDLELKTIVYGPLDIHDRAARVAEQEREAAERRAKAKAEKEKQTARWQRAVGIRKAEPTPQRTLSDDEVREAVERRAKAIREAIGF